VRLTTWKYTFGPDESVVTGIYAIWAYWTIGQHVKGFSFKSLKIIMIDDLRVSESSSGAHGTRPPTALRLAAL
jgi:hypothetical protein